ncbi:Bifunctional dehydrogenase and ferrochelatase [Ceratobasidium sp. UAMH 11750]|nr:Bifunctional dehydrogenase and ferrochelatase [Ceratobasidium sp. UAMH 11750]
METPPPIRPDASLLLAWQLKGRNVLIVGGGTVAAGRLDAVLDASARVTLVSRRDGLDKGTAYRIFDDVPEVRERIEYLDHSLPAAPFLGDAIRQVGILRTRLRKRAPGVGGSLGRKRMKWMIKVCDTWTFEELADLDDEMMERLLSEGWERNMRVPTYASLGGKLRRPGWFPNIPTGAVPALAGFTAGVLAATALVLLRRR